jgi:hypothetical protein
MSNHEKFDTILRILLLFGLFFTVLIQFFIVILFISLIPIYFEIGLIQEYLPNFIFFVKNSIKNIFPLISEYIPLIKETISNVYLALLN